MNKLGLMAVAGMVVGGGGVSAAGADAPAAFGNGDSATPDINATGRYVVFSSVATKSGAR